MKVNFQPIIDYVEGKMSIVKFQELFNTDKLLQKTLQLPMDRQYSFLKPYRYNYYCFFKNSYEYKDKSWDTIIHRSGIQGELIRFLDEYNKSYEEYEKYQEDHEFLISIQPSWLYADSDILDFIVYEIPQGLSKAKRIALGKQKVKELFRYNKTYPRWIQGAEWPIVNGKPLVFSHQERDKTIGDDFTKYYFYDPETNEQVIVEQFS